MTRLSRVVVTMGIAALLGAASGCAFSIGGGSTEEVQSKTWGQQLLDLKKAFDNGALTDSEYTEAKKKVIHAAMKN